MSRRRRKREAAPALLDIDTAVDIADDADLPDGAYWALIEELTGKEPGEVAEYLSRKEERHIK